MAAGGSGAAPKDLHDLLQMGAVGGLSDGELLERFVRRGGTSAEAAFAALVERHGPMVLRLCRTLLRDTHEAEDAFQATFLVLARRAGSIREPGLLGNWLYGVTQRVARKVRAKTLRRRSHEVRESEMSTLEVPDPAEQHDLTLAHQEQAGLIHQEVQRLSEKHRAVLVLCCFEDLTIEETARRLRCSSGAVRGRLAEARARLKSRLARRGFAVSSAIIASTLSSQAAKAAVTPTLQTATIQAAMSFVDKAAASGAASGTTVEVATKVSKFMAFSPLKLPLVLLVALTTAGAGFGALAYLELWLPRNAKKVPPLVNKAEISLVAQDSVSADPRQLIENLDWLLSAIDRNQKTISVQVGRGQSHPPAFSLTLFRDRLVPTGLRLSGLKITGKVRVDMDGRPLDLGKIHQGMHVKLELTPGQFTVAGVHARSEVPLSPSFFQIVDAVDTSTRTLSFSLQAKPFKLVKVPVVKGAAITLLEAVPNGVINIRKVAFEDVRPNMPTSIDLEVGKSGDLQVGSLTCAPSPKDEE